MESMDWLRDNELLQFFRRNKTEMSCMENPQTFLRQLRDHDLLLDETYEKVIRMQSIKKIKNGLYEILDRLESKQPQDIRAFWTCVFKETILNEYPTLRLLRNDLMNGTFQFDIKQSERAETEEADEGKRKDVSEDEEEAEKQESPVKKKRKLKNRDVCDEEEEQPGPSSRVTPRKRPEKIRFSSPLKKGEKNDIWNWDLYKSQLPVTCGEKEGILSRKRLADGEKCITVGRQWFSPGEFERFAGKGSSKNWKMTITCLDTTLGKLIQTGHLKAENYRAGCKKTKKTLFPTDDVTTVSEEEVDEDSDQDSSSSTDISTAGTDEEGEREEQTGASHDSGRKVFKVTCGPLAGDLHKKRFATGVLGKSIRTETRWMTPMQFMLEACPTYLSWRKDIECEGKALGDHIKANILRIHKVRCDCNSANREVRIWDDENNDDECFICKSGEEDKFVMCDTCPRSFHQKCHLPHVEDNIIRDGNQWMCTVCVYKANENLYPSESGRGAALARTISQRLLHCQYLLLCLRSADKDQIFASNPCGLERYSSVIKTPMWLDNVAGKLQKKLYQTVREFVSDIQLIFSNSASYNQDNAGYLATGNRLKELFDKEFNSVFNISEQTVG
ncbi:nuclear body protein SP140-like protein [Gymnodraco acuticeps]|uniref:Nuclear body protein SP140-like protein n=1 Tax=Gymnodraco acuticeps TaxID=8218 RepID=A0A6P8TBJ6_GYMAC|nr:nuclear body protein SP140-like protein [Gymnodraco acuticeps]